MAGSYVEPGSPIFLVVEDEEAVEELVRLLVRIGLDDVSGYLIADEVFASGEADCFDSIPIHRTSELTEHSRAESALVLDVRKASEYAGGHLDGALNIAHTRLAARLDEIPADKTLLVHCASGVRAASASSYLRSKGREVCYFNGSVADALR
jgi:hydroxyacylglutathione hydrolase